MKFAVLSAVTSIALVSCGNKKEETVVQAPVVSKTEAVSTASTLPKMVLIAVPLDAQGKEINDKAIFAINKDAVAINSSNAAQVFVAGQAPKIAELDENSSRQSFFGWRLGCGRHCGGQRGGRGNFYNINNGIQQINNGGNGVQQVGYQNNLQPFAGNWNTYQPSYHQNNFDWSYGCQNSQSNVNFGGYNQGGYNSNYSSGYSSSYSASSYSNYNVYSYGQNAGYGWNGIQY